MTRILRTAIKSRTRGRAMMVICLNCVQALAPDWPVLILWPLLKVSAASSIAHLSGRKRHRARLRAQAAFARILQENYPQCLPTRRDAVTIEPAAAPNDGQPPILPHRTV